MNTPARDPGNRSRGRTCSGCGELLRNCPSYYSLCSCCYWTRQWRAVQAAPEQITSLETQVAQLRDEMEQNERERRKLLSERTWWTNLLSSWRDWTPPEAEQKNTKTRWELQKKLSDSEREKERLERLTLNKKAIRKNHRGVQKAKERLAHRNEIFAKASLSQIGLPDYRLEKFLIRRVDYRRGNPLDNHFRKSLFASVVSDFDGQCLVCGDTEDLALDHFAIPKNSGGNFALWVEETAGIQLNVTVLCRSCNSSKNEMAFDDFFTMDEIAKILKTHEILLRRILEDDVALGVIRKWYKNGRSRRRSRRSNQGTLFPFND